jgi:dTDP-4-dehydrorhamnose reductase
MNNILVTGANGQLGSEIRSLSNVNLYQNNFFLTDYLELDITDKSAIKEFVINNNIDSIINCAAYTAVDLAEKEVEKAEKINAIASKYLAEIAKEFNCKFVHVSTDYVFDGTNYKPYVEIDTPNPTSVYGKTKLQGEIFIQDINPKNTIIIRTSWVYSSYGNNFVKTMLRLGKEKQELGVIFDQIGTPSFAGDLAKVILEILPKIKNEEVEVFHYSNEGICSWYDFAKAIFEYTNTDCKVNPITTSQYPTAAKRPHYSVLEKSKIKETYNVDIPYWSDSLRVCLKNI